jgi:hypothetical protein
LFPWRRQQAVIGGDVIALWYELTLLQFTKSQNKDGSTL